MAWAAIGTAAFSMLTAKDEKGGGGAGDAALAAIAKATQSASWQRATERPLEDIEPAASAKERGEYLVRMVQAIQNNETEGASAMDSVAASLMADMRNTEGGRIPDQPVVQPQQSSASKFVHGFKGERPEEPVFTFLHSTDQPLHQGAGRVPPTDEEKERSSFVNLPESFF